MQIAFFDLDGTITRQDSLLPYVLRWLLKSPQRLPRLWRMLPALLKFAYTRDRGALKSTLIQAALGGVERSRIDALNAEFLPPLISQGLHADALTAIDFHRRAGHRLILMSASVDLYVPQIGQALQFDETLCTRLRWDGSRVNGALASANCRGDEKRRLLMQWRDAHPGCTIIAYGNSRSDLPHLRAADHGVLVNASAAVCRLARAEGVDCRKWR
jgi:phosphatidylglycerophosphatase C